MYKATLRIYLTFLVSIDEIFSKLYFVNTSQYSFTGSEAKVEPQFKRQFVFVFFLLRAATVFFPP